MMRCVLSAIFASLLITNGVGTLVRVNASSQGPHGSAGCQCIGIDQLEGDTTATLKNGQKVAYPADLGARCQAWDGNTHPKCTGASPPDWCKQKWCYVDPCKCDGLHVLPKPSSYLPDSKYQGKQLHFSYATCGGHDSYSAKEEKKTAKEIEKTCAVSVDAAKWGASDCRCVGIGPQPGTTKVNIEDKLVAFPADTGATCKAWDKDNSPECSGASAPDWCAQKWCFVDPCSCKLATPPKTSSYLASSNFQGKPIYYSYATCGGTDSYTKGRKEACVNQKTRAKCGALDKCAWTGKECLGKELVDVCGLVQVGRPLFDADVTPVESKGIDIDTAMPYGDLEPFGREDTAQELTEASIRESDQMVDQLERAEVAEEKRSVFRALTRLRGAAITSYDGVARSQTGNIDEYSKVHQWRHNHPLHHLADEESDVSKWAFPENAD